MNGITVSIFMLTYNQEQYIAQAIESVLMQKTNFSYQLVIGEDCSDDQTEIICKEYEVRYPNKIKLLPSLKKNIGLMANYVRTIKECDGKYIAICDGDDYWIDENKLQKQVDFLEYNPDFSIVHTNYKRVFSKGEPVIPSVKNFDDNGDFDYLVFGNYIISVTVLFKNIQKKDSLPPWIIRFPYGDWPTYLWTIRNEGKIHFLDDVTAAYRTDIGVTSTTKNFKIVDIKILKCIVADTNFSHKKEIIMKSINRMGHHLMKCYNWEKKYFEALKQYIYLIRKEGNKFQITKIYLNSIKSSFKSR